MNARRRGILTLVVLAAAVAALVLPRLLSHQQASSGGSSAAAPEERLRVQVLELAPERLDQRLATTGTLRANESVELTCEIAGKVVRILFEEGRPVAAGQLLLKIDDAELVAQRQRVVHQVNLARLREERQRQLREEGVVSQQEYDLAASELSVLQAQLALVEAQLEKTEIRAPFAGVIGLRRVSEGSYLSPQTRIARLQSLDPVKLDFTVPEKYAAAVRPGVEVIFRVKSSEEAGTGTIYAVEPTVDPETRSLVVRATSPNPDGSLLPGAFADVELVVGVEEEALMVPSIAVVPELGGKKVFILEDGTAQPRPVETGIRTKDRLQITRGLAAGERVIVSAIPRLRAGLSVEATAPAARSGDTGGER